MGKSKDRAKRIENPLDRAFNHISFEPDIWDTTTKFVPEDLTDAIRSADDGILSYAADICDAQWTDDRVRGTLQTRIGALMGLNNDEKLEFWCKNERVQKAIKEDWWISAPETELARLLRWGIHLGVGVAQRKVVKNEGRWVPRLQTWNPRNLRYRHNDHLWEIDTSDKGIVTIEPTDPNWVMFFPYGESRPWAEGSWRAVGLLWLIKTMGLRAWGKHNELHGSGGLKGTAPESAQPADLTQFWAKLKAMGRNARIVLPAGYDITMLEATGRTWETFPKAMDKSDTGIAIIHLGQPMTTEVPNNAQTGSDNARAVRQDYLEMDAETVSTWAHDKHLTAWAEWNYADVELSPYPRYNSKPPVNMQLESTALTTLGTAIEKLDQVATSKNLVIDVEQLLFRYDVPFRKMTPKEIEGRAGPSELQPESSTPEPDTKPEQTTED